MRKRRTSPLTIRDLFEKLEDIEEKIDKRFDKIELKIDGSSIWAYMALAAAGSFGCFSFAYIFKSSILAGFGYICAFFVFILIIMLLHNYSKQIRMEKD